jgi:hypothetical protein
MLLKDIRIFYGATTFSALVIASNPFFHAQTKNIELNFHFFREKVFDLSLAPTSLQIFFTEAFPSPQQYEPHVV